MDRKERGLNSIGLSLRMGLFIIWVLLSTVVYGIGCILLSIAWRRAARGLGRLWAKHLLAVGGVKIKVVGKKLTARERYVFISNHQSALDIPVLIAGLSHQLAFIAKKELFFIPFFGWGIAAMGHIWIDRTNARKARASIARAVRTLEKENVSLILFPEGTRSPDGSVKEFKQGSFSVAIDAKAKVVPVAIKNARELLPKGSSKIRSGTIVFELGTPIDITGFKATDKSELSKLVKQRITSMMAKGT